MSEAFQKLYIAVERFGPPDSAWRDFVGWSGLTNLEEVVGLDSLLNRPALAEIEDEYWKHIVNEDHMLDFFTDFDFMLRQLPDIQGLNILGVIKAPTQDVSELDWSDFRFLGYELLDQDNAISALTNCGGFPEAFTIRDLTEIGLVASFDRATEVQQALRTFYPEERHADCNIWAIFRWQGGHLLPASRSNLPITGRQSPAKSAE